MIIMKEKIILLSVLKYTDKKTNLEKVRLGFVFADKKFNTSNKCFKGHSEMSCFYDNLDVFDKIPNDIFLTSVDAILETKSNPVNPLKETKVVKQLVINGSILNLL